MSGHRLLPRPRRALAALALVATTTLTACSGSLGTGSGPTTTDPPLKPDEMCALGKDVFQDIYELEDKKPEYLDEVKKSIKRLAPRAPEEIFDDVKAWVDHVQGVKDQSELVNLPPELKVSTDRIDAWWTKHCGEALIKA